MTSNPYLMFNGNCDEALKFYEKNLGAKVAFKMTYADAPEKNACAAGMEKKIMHARLMVGSGVVMVSDCPPERYQKPQGISMSLGIETPEEADKIFKALSENGTVLMPIEETFWAKRFGMLEDQLAFRG